LEALPEKRTLRNLAFAPDGRALVAAENVFSKESGALRMWDVPSGRLVAGFQGPPELEGYFSLAFASDGRSLVAGHVQLGARILDAATGTELASIPVSPANRRQSLAFAEDGRTLALGTGGASVKLWDPLDKKELPPLRSSTGFNSVCGLAFTHGPGLVAATPDGQVLYWPRLSADRNVGFALPGGLRGAVIASDGRHLITANANGTVYVFRLCPVAESSAR
jgi:WD40 repeat protein